jgi:SAM-dependent methyltransferase
MKRRRRPTVGWARDLIRDADQRAGVMPAWRALLDESAVVDAAERDDVPIPHADDREGYYFQNHLNYWLSGAVDLQSIRSLIPSESLARVLDFGGATGRVARHLSLTSESQLTTIAEISFDHVQWVGAHFGPKVRAVKVGSQPHFPLADASVTACLGFSVFTHISSFESGWLAEINRVLTDGGYAYLTVHSEHTWKNLPEHLVEMMSADPSFREIYNPQAPMPEERLVFESNPGTVRHCCNTFVSTDYVRRVWSRWLEIVDIRPLAHNGHTIVVLRKSNGAA